MKETLQVINQMQADGVIGKYAIGGAIGATFYLEPVSTFDIDIFVSFEQKSGSLIVSPAPIYDYLTRLGYEFEKEHMVVKDWPVQFIPANDPLNNEALVSAVETNVGEVKTWVITAEHLMAIALKTGRLKDFARLARFVEDKAFDADTLNGILERHGLLKKWAQFNQKYILTDP